MASLQRHSAHTKYHSGPVVSKSLGAREEKAVFKVRQKVESPLPCSHHHCTSPHTEQGAGVGQGCGSLPVLPITLCLMPCTVPSSSEPHGKGHMGSSGWESLLPRERGGARVDSRELRWGTATSPAIGREPKPCVARAQPSLPAPPSSHPRHRAPRLPWLAALVEGGCCGSDGALLVLLPVTPLLGN